MKFDEPDFSEEDDEKVIAKYKALLTGAEDQAFKDDVNEDSEASDGAMEMTYVPEAEKNTAAEEKALEDMTPWEKYLNKKKEKNKKKKEKIGRLFLSETEKDNLPEITKALSYVKKGSQRLCKNNLTLATADRVSS